MCVNLGLISNMSWTVNLAQCSQFKVNKVALTATGEAEALQHRLSEERKYDKKRVLSHEVGEGKHRIGPVSAGSRAEPGAQVSIINGIRDYHCPFPNSTPCGTCSYTLCLAQIRSEWRSLQLQAQSCDDKLLIHILCGLIL